MERVELRKLPWPELTLVAVGLLFILVLMVRTSSTACHHWKQRITELSGAYLAAAGEVEYPRTGTGRAIEDEDRASLRNHARQVLDDRPVGCL
jgi:hypothetical protein